MKRIISILLVLCMAVGLVPVQALAEEVSGEPQVLPVQDLPDAEYDESLPYVGFAAEQGTLPEEGAYTLTLRRTGNLSEESAVVVETVDISARYGTDYRVEDPIWETEVLETTSTLLERSGDEINRQQAQTALDGLRDGLLGAADGTEEATPSETPADDSSLAALKARQSGQPVRGTWDSEQISLAESIVRQVNPDVADYVEPSSSTRVLFAPGEAEQTLTFRVLEDSESEGQELFNLLLSADDDHTAAIEAARSLSFILEDDEPAEHSVLSLAAEEFRAEDGRVMVTVTREEALYTYVTAGLRASENGTAAEGVDFSATDVEVVLQPYQTRAVVEIPVISSEQEKSFSVELYDLKGPEPGEIMTARAVIPAAASAGKDGKSDSSYLDPFVSGAVLMSDSYPTKVTIDRDYTIKYNDSSNPSIGSIMYGNSVVGPSSSAETPWRA